MALGIKKITESVVEDRRSLVMIGSYSATEDMIEFDDNNAVEAGALLASVDGTVHMKTSLDHQMRINADTSLKLESVTTRVLGYGSVTREKIAKNAVTEEKIANNAVTTNKLKNSCVTKEKIANKNVTSDKLDNHCVQNIHLNSRDDYDDNSKRSVDWYNIRNNAIRSNHIQNEAVTSVKIAKNSITFNHLDPSLAKRITNLENRVTSLENKIEDLIEDINNRFKNIENKITQIEKSLGDRITSIEKIIQNNKLQNAIVHNGAKSVGTKYTGSTQLVNLQCTGDIEGKRVFFMTYQDLAEAYMPGEHLQPGDIVALHEDGLVYKAESTDPCIVGVISDEFANCLGATKEELFNGWKVAVGMIGKVHVKVKGPVKLGQQINVSLSEPGIGCGSSNPGIGKALETIDCDFDEIHEVLVQIRPL